MGRIIHLTKKEAELDAAQDELGEAQHRWEAIIRARKTLADFRKIVIAMQRESRLAVLQAKEKVRLCRKKVDLPKYEKKLTSHWGRL